MRPKLMRINHLLLILFAMTLVGHAEPNQLPTHKINNLAVAISHAEGFGQRRTNLPTRYHNPGDLKSRRDLPKLPGQRYLGKGGHVVFSSDEAGWAALRGYIQKMVDGRSRRYRPNMTLAQVARMYAGNWRPWVKIVSTELGVPPNTTLATYFHEDVVEPPALVFPAPKLDLVSPVPVVGSPFVFEAAEDRAGRPLHRN